MTRQGKLVVTNGAGQQPGLAEMVMAWARDVATGEPRYILELDEAHRGARCGCECPSCGLALTAVNAAKDEVHVRPHFRHPKGAERDECLVLACRAAALRHLQEDGWLDLPRRRRSATAVGLSGELYEAWVELPAERLRIKDVSYRDRVAAVITFDDGRQLRVELTGTVGQADYSTAASGRVVPTIFIDVGEANLAGMGQDELRQRLRLLPNAVCWRAHWNDEHLDMRAAADARLEALRYLDELPEGFEFPEGLDPALRRETVLHFEVKRILQDVGRMAVPEIAVEVELPVPGGRTLYDKWVVEAEELRLECVELELRYGRLVPDITCEAFWPDGHAAYLPLLIEVTVTNHVDEERLERIRDHGEATLEIDLSRAGGRVTRDDLRQLVVDELEMKRWLCHPDSEIRRAVLEDGLVKKAARIQLENHARATWLADRRAKVLATPVGDIAAEYLDAVTKMLDAYAATRTDGRMSRAEAAAERAGRERVADAVDKMALHGYPEAGDELLIQGGSMLSRILTIKLGRSVGYRYTNVMSVLNATRQVIGNRRSTLSIYFIAAKAYPLDLTLDQQEWFDAWAAEVRQSILDGETTYLRDPFYDRLLSLLFPEMSVGLAKPFGKLDSVRSTKWDPVRQMFVRPEVPERRRAQFISEQPRSDGAGATLIDTKPGQWWLKGRDLERWKRANPEAARAWFNDPQS